MRHTKGNWKWYKKNDMPEYYSDLQGDEGEILSWAYVKPLNKDKEEYGYVEVSEANAKLIAAAPELLKACINIKESGVSYLTDDNNTFLNQAIKKATL